MAAGNTYVALATQTLSSAVSSVTFSSIPQGYTDLVLEAVGRTATASVSDSYLLTVNGDTSSVYSRTRLLGTGSAASSANRTSAPNVDFEGVAGNSAASGVYGFSTINLQNYSNSSTYKSILIRGNDANNYVESTIARWGNTAAITNVTLTTSSGSNLMTGSTFTIYGILAA